MKFLFIPLLSLNLFSQVKEVPFAPIYTTFFDSGDTSVEKHKDFLYLHVVQLIKSPNPPALKIYLEGQTDDLGNEETNLELSRKRVNAVAEYLIDKGFRKEQIFTTYYGETMPEIKNTAVSTKLEDKRKANRRVVIRIECEANCK